jgi:transposase-like protein
MSNQKRICPHCREGVLELTASTKFKGDYLEYYICTDCDSTYNVDQVDYFIRMGNND